MEINKQENTQEILQNNLLDGLQPSQAAQDKKLPTVAQLVLSKAYLDEVARLEKIYHETIERENK